MENTSLIPPTFYKNTGYSFDRIERKSLIIDSGSFTAVDKTPYEFTISLPGEPLVLDKQYDIFLEALTTFGGVGNKTGGGANMGFFLKINEFNIQSIGNLCNGATIGTDLTAGLFIPNDAGTSDATTTTSHKSKKLNFICTINPCKLTTISGSISDVHLALADRGSGFTGGANKRFIAEFVFVPRN